MNRITIWALMLLVVCSSRALGAEPPRAARQTEKAVRAAEREAAKGLRRLGASLSWQRSHVVTVGLRGVKRLDEALRLVGSLGQLRTLRLPQRDVGDDMLAGLKNLDQLRALDLSGTKITDEGLAHLAKFSQLRTLDLSGTNITGEGLKQLAGLANLAELSLAETNVTDAGLAHLAKLRQLRRLSLRGSRVTDHGARHLIPLAKLEQLDVGRRISWDALNYACSEKILHALEGEQRSTWTVNYALARIRRVRGGEEFAYCRAYPPEAVYDFRLPSPSNGAVRHFFSGTFDWNRPTRYRGSTPNDRLLLNMTGVDILFESIKELSAPLSVLPVSDRSPMVSGRVKDARAWAAGEPGIHPYYLVDSWSATQFRKGFWSGVTRLRLSTGPPSPALSDRDVGRFLGGFLGAPTSGDGGIVRATDSRKRYADGVATLLIRYLGAGGRELHYLVEIKYEGKQLVINRKYEFDLSGGKTYIVIQANGAARELRR